ncbi:endo-beta-N-acetylglucosaminidase H [Brachybacterium alimentarium]|uniref:Chitinase n=2 Tax=Brachybacterium alimentarium TaxID=47845 RepID=A0A2A3YJ17_9MICO|nr:endo-beta-N-acetylglucosaminidase H [Brachybacterium alimentarium]PCC39085.1 chitinase [Brachybacterium alimentarium]RCS64464.1 chitinase [Brachybacterium alimentarium]RCS65433.1 chitinase [Brachybacterium alimentarium]RCS84086.1 chitinase [Brachybacterium alimentarium]
MTRIHRRTLLAGVGGAALGGVGAGSLATPAVADPMRHGDRIASVAYIEVNDNSLLNVGRYTLDDGGAAFDIAVIFAANINYDGESAYLSFNENVQHVLDNVDTCVRPLQQKGIKVVLSVLGNHQGAGIANFPDRRAADRFAQELSTVVRRYRLDGVDLDDEWSDYGANGTGQPNPFSFVYFVKSLRKKLPNRLITFYVIGPSAENQEYEGLRVGDMVDHAWNPYYGSFQDYEVPGLPQSQYGAAAVDLGSDPSPELVEQFAQRTADGGYGAFVTYQLQPGDQSELVSAMTEPLYGSRAKFG